MRRSHLFVRSTRADRRAARAGALEVRLSALQEVQSDAALSTKLVDAPVNADPYVRQGGAWVRLSIPIIPLS